MASTLVLLVAAAAIISVSHTAAIGSKQLHQEAQKSIVSTTNAYTPIQAEDFLSESGVAIWNSGVITYVGSVDNGDYTCYDQVDFQDGAVGISVRLSSSLEAGITGSIDLVLGSPSNNPFHTIIVGTTHGDSSFITVTEFLEDNSANGVWELCLVYRDSHSTQSFVNIDYFSFFQ